MKPVQVRSTAKAQVALEGLELPMTLRQVYTLVALSGGPLPIDALTTEIKKLTKTPALHDAFVAEDIAHLQCEGYLVIFQ